MAEEDIFMDYAGSSSPIDSEKSHPSKIQMNIPRIGNNINEIIFERSIISSNLRSSSSNIQETRLKVLQLRRFNRHLSNVITDHRKRLNEFKDTVDSLNSKLLCQKFEKHHLLDEIKTCLSSKYTELAGAAFI
jgi:flagellar biosynthesis chaperone FliJ